MKNMCADTELAEVKRYDWVEGGRSESLMMDGDGLVIDRDGVTERTTLPGAVEWMADCERACSRGEADPSVSTPEAMAALLGMVLGALAGTRVGALAG